MGERCKEMPIVNDLNIPKIKYDAEGNAIKPYQYLDEAWNRYINLVKKYAEGMKCSQREIIEREIIMSPPVRIRIGRNGKTNRLTEEDFRAVVNKMISHNQSPKHTEIAKRLGTSRTSLWRYCTKHWHVLMPHSHYPPFHPKYVSPKLKP